MNNKNSVLLIVTHECAAAEALTPPGLHFPPDQHADFFTDDCIRVYLSV